MSGTTLTGGAIDIAAVTAAIMFQVRAEMTAAASIY